LPILHRLMARLGRIPPEAIPELARGLNLSRAEVHGVVTYYADFRSEGLGARVVEVCRAEACQALGGEVLLERARVRTGCGDGVLRSADGLASVLPVYCLGLCASSPAVRIDGRLHGCVTPERLDRLLDAPSPERGAPEAVCSPGQGEAPSVTGSPTNAKRVFLPRDSAAKAAGADEVAAALVAGAAARGETIDLVRTSSRGAFWLEPLVEVETPDGRVGYGPVAVADVESLLAADGLHGGAHALCVGRIDALPYLARQQRQIFRRAGVTEPLSLTDYQAHGGLRGLRASLARDPAATRQEVLDSGLRGRGGAAFPAGIKWRTVADTAASQKFVVCNADEGDSGTFADRMLLEGDPYLLIEGMAIAAIAVGATRGFVYVRSEYPDAVATLQAATSRARQAGWLGTSVLGSAHAFELELRVGAGSYVCGEETAMLESLEGRRGIVRAKPPLPAVAGLFGKPTLIQNALMLPKATTVEAL
jgi:formate dehydrogenase iron-sulfur subunit